jgi:Flp pilus assembly protein TadD
LRNSLKLDPRLGQGLPHVELSQVLMAQGRWTEAAEEASAAIGAVRKGDLHIALVCKGQAMTGLRRYPEAAQSFREAVALRGDDRLAVTNLAWLLATCPQEGVRNGSEALSLAHRGCELSGNSSNSLDVLAGAQARCGRYDEAVATMRKAVELGARDKVTPQFIQRYRMLRLETYLHGQPWQDQ